MNPREAGFLLLSSRLGDPRRRPLTVQQLGQLGRCVACGQRPAPDRELRAEDLLELGCSGELAERVLSLLSDGKLLNDYVNQGRKDGCYPLTRISPYYPEALRVRLEENAPPCLWVKGDTRLLGQPAVALVGSRDLRQQTELFARQVGYLAARNGYVLISGNARGADRAAQESCLAAGGRVISVVADSLRRQPLRKNMLYISEEGFDLPFTSNRALSRNRLIHCMGQKVFVSQCGDGFGGTWSGTRQNLRGRWTPVFCFSDGSSGALQLQIRGAALVDIDELQEVFDG